MDFFTEYYNIFRGIHEGSWAFLVVLFIVAFVLYRSRKLKAATILHMITRLFYLFMLVSGIGMLVALNFNLFYVVKGLLAVLVIGFMEMAAGKAKRNENSLGSLFIVLVLVLVVVLMGFGVINF
ncbi:MULTISPECIES: DUF1516 family protein [Shouchella]|uniref:Uncharacterized protein n=3 Tax=Bacillaceae TaxID=186817 RepID=A0A060M5L2_9BACI|nr:MULTISPECIES: DUF1516 family protein [Bacillaceae]RQW21185.1 DUF1516 family protein [Bacillus sp. C1-1]AIC95379.1 hypothetical protein BleG1_2814 [Shouchella lehensis G1]KQL55599.1 hypothetical protein AN965_17160 [Alkalicoccobacillus plakortidis]MBG9783828.1 hypothetical protein [Shouchella lehensis]TES51210.1 DUF1516 family protein [Shouchella lehensis]